MTEAQIPLFLSAILFSLGALGVVIRRNPLVMFMCIEMMLNAANLALVSFSRYSSYLPAQKDPNDFLAIVPQGVGSAADGPMLVFLVMTVAAAEAVIGLGIIIAIFRTRKQVDVDEMSLLKG